MNNKILLVDDLLPNKKLLKKVLEANYEIEMASSGKEALELSQTFRPAVIFLDISMPGMDGIEVCEKIRKRDYDPYVKIIFITANALSDMKIKGYDAGADDYITKPIDIDEIKAKAKVYFRLYNSEWNLFNVNSRLNELVEEKTQGLLEKEALAAIGINTSTIVHNLKNPLFVLSSTLELIEIKGFEQRYLDKLKRSQKDLHRLIEEVLLDSKESFKNNESVELIDALKNSLESIKSHAHDLAIDSNLSEFDSCLVDMKEIHLNQIFSNLFTNAFEAAVINKQKQLTFTFNIDTNNSHHINLTIQDNGPGVAEHLQSEIFKPFYTTKAHRDDLIGGTGIGLASCKKMIDSYGGSLEYLNRLDGACFSLILPKRKMNETN